MNQNSKNPVQNLTKIDYLTIVFSPNEVARCRFDAKLAFGNGDFSSYKEAYNAMLCAELFENNATDDFAADAEQSNFDIQNNTATDDLEVDVSESVIFNSDYFYNELFESNLAGSSKYRKYKSIKEIPEEDRKHFLKNIVRKTKRYKTLTSLIEGDISKFMHLLNTEVATAADRLTSDTLSWSYRDNSGGMFTYEKSATLYRHDVNSGVIAWGANNGGVMISFTGTGCAGLDIPKLHSMIQKMPNVKITRLDIAYDDYEGNRTIQDYFQNLEEGAFCKTNQKPKWSLIKTGELQKISPEEQGLWRKKHGWQKRYDCVANGGNTLYVGSRKNGKMARMYEKGKQMESESQPNWVRAELELRSIDRVISLDALLNTDAVFAAAYPAFAFITAERLEIRTTSRERINNGLLVADRLQRYCKQSYGKLLNFLRHIKELSDKDIIDQLTKGLDSSDVPDSINQDGITPEYLIFLRHAKELSDKDIIDKLTKGLNPWDIPKSIIEATITPPNQMEFLT
ncbi:replication initiation factor domain-containing protein [Pseudoalteromonas rhizosphaerae]|uniref:replication initiation factor domain-containing protein n=1 Tax=Pseudoalteromonas rhizosphaerae TaxID=2518973 RepID=UPI00237FBA51|nr:replication initiation factor domain-containing protein [Pseudoalteromonas rhizosphaerae]